MIELASAHRSSSATPGQFYARWVDHASWADWSPDTEWARVEGPVRAGAQGVLRPKGGPKAKFVISECEPDRVYTDVTKFPGARLTFRHTVAPNGSGSELTVRVWLDGPVALFWAKTAGRGFRTSVPADLDRLIALAERG